MNNMIKIQKTSSRLRFIILSLIFLLPILVATYWMFFNYLPKDIFQLPVLLSQEPDFTTRLFALFVSFVPMSIVIFGLFVLAKLFKLYERGIVFTNQNVLCYRKLGFVIIFWVIAKTLYIPILAIILTYKNPVGERLVSVQFGSLELSALIIGAVVLVISRIMEEARKLDDEQSLTV